MRFAISPSRILVALLTIIVLLNIANAMGGLYVFLARPAEMPWLVKMVHFDHERNLPTYYQSAALAISAVLLLVAGGQSAPALGRYWIGLTLIFSYMSIDEFTQIHERFIPIVRRALGTSDFLFFAWVIPYSAATLVLGLVFLRFLTRLPTPTRRIFILSAVVYLGGAIGLEMLGGHYYDTLGRCGLRMTSVSNDNEQQKIVQEFQSEFESKKKECSVVLVSNSTSAPDKWTVAGFNDEGQFKSVLIDDLSNELSVELKKGSANESKVIELVTSRLGRSLLGARTPHYQLTMTLEETLEMVGIALFIFGLLRHIAADRETLVIQIGGE